MNKQLNAFFQPYGNDDKTESKTDGQIVFTTQEGISPIDYPFDLDNLCTKMKSMFNISRTKTELKNLAINNTQKFERDYYDTLKMLIDSYEPTREFYELNGINKSKVFSY